MDFANISLCVYLKIVTILIFYAIQGSHELLSIVDSPTYQFTIHSSSAHAAASQINCACGCPNLT